MAPGCLNLGACKIILNVISNPAAQPENCLLPSGMTNLFTQKHPLFLGEMICLLGELIKVQSRHE